MQVKRLLIARRRPTSPVSSLGWLADVLDRRQQIRLALLRHHLVVGMRGQRELVARREGAAGAGPVDDVVRRLALFLADARVRSRRPA